MRYRLALTTAALAALTLAGPAAADASQRMTQAEANIAIATLDERSPGRVFELVQPFADDAAFGQMRLLPGKFERVGARAGLVNTAAVVNGRSVLLTLLVRERPRSGRIILRPVL